MEDAATAEISRVSLHKWIKSKVVTEDGEIVTPDFICEEIRKEGEVMTKEGQMKLKNISLGVHLCCKMVNNETMDDFLTTICYPFLVQFESEF